MAAQCWTLWDEQQGTHRERLRVGEAQLSDALEGCEILHRRLEGGLSDGVDVVRIQCGDLVVELLPTRGMGIGRAWVRGERIGWQSPVSGPVHPKFVCLGEPSGFGWLDGFDEWFVRCGLESNGAPEFDAHGRLKYGLHGRIANRPAQRVQVQADSETGQISVTGVVEEARFLHRRLRMTSTLTLKAGELAIQVRDEIQNCSAIPTEMQMLYHINFGPPLLGPGARFVAPVRRVVPCNPRSAEGITTWSRYGDAEAGFIEQAYFLELLGDAQENSLAMLRNAAEDRGVSLQIDRRQLPYFTLWKNTASHADGYVTGLEPGTNFPNRRSFEGSHGRVVPLEPDATTSFDVRVEFHCDADSVRQVEQAISDIRGTQSPEVCDQPQADWCIV